MTSAERPFDHADVLEALDLAAVEPGGLTRLAVAPGPGDSAVVAHLAACGDCATELARLRRVDGLLRAGMGPGPTPELRERTLALIRDVGIERGEAIGGASAAGAVAAADAGVAVPVLEPAAGAPDPGPAEPIRLGERRRRGPGFTLWAAGLAAAVVIAVAGTAFVVGSAAQRTTDAERAQNAAAVAVAQSALGLVLDPTVIRIPMASPSGAATGLVLIAPGDYRTAVVAAGLPEAPVGQEYACYVVIDGARVLVGRMAERGDIHAWTGTVDAFAGVAGSSIGEYGVVLVPVGSESVDGTPILSGSL
jgi:hypothetical protein